MKKTLGILLVLCMLFTIVLSGCSETTESSPKEETKTETKETTKTETKETEEKPEEEGSKGVIKQLLAYTSTDPNLEPPVALISQLTGYELEFYNLPAEGADEKLNVELSTGVEYDFMRLSISQFYSLVGKGALVDFGDKLDVVAPNLAATYKTEEWATGMYEGGTYGIPQFDALYISGAIGYHREVLTDLGFTDAPTTIDELTEVLKAVKENTDMIPLTGSGAYQQTIGSGFGLSSNEWMDVNGTLVNRIETQQWKDYISYMAMLYAQELIDPEWPINTGETKNEKFTTGAAFGDERGWWDGATINPAIQENTGHTVEYINLLTDDSGRSNSGVSVGPRAFCAIPVTCTDVDKVLDYLNERSDPDNIRPIFIGVEGVQHEVRTETDGSESYWPIFPAFKEWFNGHYFNATMPADSFTTLWLCRVRKSEIMYEVFAKMNVDADDKFVINPLSFAPPIEDVNKHTQPSRKLADDFFIEIIAGTKTLEADYDTFITKWKAEGGEAMTNAVNNWYASK